MAGLAIQFNLFQYFNNLLTKICNHQMHFNLKHCSEIKHKSINSLIFIKKQNERMLRESILKKYLWL